MSDEVTERPISGATDAAEATDQRRWLALAVIGVAQLMVILDATIVTVALPSAQRDLGITDAARAPR